MVRCKLVVSDLHMGSGHRQGQLNPWESFSEDARFQELLHYYSTGAYASAEVELILNGDIFDFLHVATQQGFTIAVTESLAIEKMRACMEGHPEVMAALATFIAMPHKRITVIPGNHDFEWVFPGVQEAFCRRLVGRATDPRFKVICDRATYEFDGIQVQHGQQLELAHNHNFLEMFLRQAGGEPILNLPWGSQFIIKVITRLKLERPYIDRVRPFKAYVIRAIVFDPLFFLMTLWLSLVHFVRTRVLSLRHFGARMRQNWRLLTEAEVYSDLRHKVQHLLDENPRVHTVILGHTHIPLIRRLPDGRQYVNSGCWTDTVSFDLGSFGQRSHPTYVYIEYPIDRPERPRVKLRRWYGRHSIYEDLRY